MSPGPTCSAMCTSSSPSSHSTSPSCLALLSSNFVHDFSDFFVGKALGPASAVSHDETCSPCTFASFCHT